MLTVSLEVSGHAVGCVVKSEHREKVSRTMGRGGGRRASERYQCFLKLVDMQWAV